MNSETAIVVGAGVGGLAAALDLATAGIGVTVVEAAAGPGGKMRAVTVAGHAIDAGPTVFTMRWVFDELLAAAGTTLEREVSLKPLQVLARHAWSEDERLDLFADVERSEGAIGVFAGAAEARRFRGFCDRAARIYSTLERPFLRGARCRSPLDLFFRAGLRRIPDLAAISPFGTLWGALADHFHDPRLRQLFGRYATYCGSSPFLAPATLMLIAHVEQQGVWVVGDGMHGFAKALARIAQRRGVAFRFGATVVNVTVADGRATGVLLASGEWLPADVVVLNTDVAALANGGLGEAVRRTVGAVPQRSRSLSALTWMLVGEAQGFPLRHHNVFFSGDYRGEFDRLHRDRRLPDDPTIYICAQDRSDIAPDGGVSNGGTAGPERLFCLVNAPPTGDTEAFDVEEIAACEHATFSRLARCGLEIRYPPEALRVVTPADFHRLFPGTGGALYGRASHGWRASFQRPGSRTRVRGLYLAGGSTHPGPGVPMAALSGRLAAASLLADLVSGRRSLRK
ncbi:1-hydroxycarotenoid 3,4-desaturase CrtD [Rhodoplanes sp. SY1]|uniref:1-hydroxycarotenoid 3,4-desaturase CrtD n=1 Tax=Rhodoplanes sp. SY1 TaxID=3166646 RepID=UPI0038B5D50F